MVRSFRLATALGLVLAAAAPLAAEEGYRPPPPAISDIVTRAPSPSVSVSPDGDQLLLIEREALPPVADLAKPMEKLAGLRLDAAINDRHGPRTAVGLSLQDIASGALRPVALPADADLAHLAWASDGSKVVFTNTRADGVDLHVLDTATAQARRIMTGGVNPIFQSPRWMADGSLLVLTVPKSRGAMPVRSLTPAGPAIQEATGGRQAQNRTYQDLLQNPHDEAMFTWLGTSQPMLVSADGRSTKAVGEPRLYTSVTPSPDGKYLLLGWLGKPFSSEVPWS
ncbi:MAG: S9 family peptidase, partial [Porphyrobacter sp.]|nr:S9 family peptidase [Porphyrobacter sp.]